MKHRLVNSNHQNNVKFFDILDKMRRKAELCDVILIASDVEVHAHKIVLSACSSYFRSMFTKFVESKKDRIIMDKIDGKVLQVLIEYMYRAEIFVAEKDVQAILMAASYLQLTDVKDACCEFLQEQLNPNNCLYIAQFAHLYDYIDVEAAANAYTEENFADVVKSDDFLQLTLHQLLKLIEKDRIMASEEEVFECVIAWVTNSTAEREKCLPDLMEKVRLPLLCYDFLYKMVGEEPLMKSKYLCMNVCLMEAVNYSSLGPEAKVLMKSPRFTPRHSKKILLAIGGDSTEEKVECFEFTGKCSFPMTDMPNERECFSAAAIGYTAYAIGGFVDGSESQSVVSLDCKTNIWSSCTDMNFKRMYPGVAVLDNLIYVIGGCDENSSTLRSAEVYNPKTKTWKTIASMKVAKYGVGVAAINGKVYVVGGLTGCEPNLKSLASMEQYCPQCDKWSNVAEMSRKRIDTGFAAMDGLLYAVGGMEMEHSLCSAEVYNPKIEKWSPIADMNFSRSGAGLIPMNNLLYVVGGYDKVGTRLLSVEVYNPKLGTWTLLPSELSLPRSYGGMTLVDRPKFLNEILPPEK